MKKLVFVATLMVAMSFAACGGNSQLAEVRLHQIRQQLILIVLQLLILLTVLLLTVWLLSNLDYKATK